MAAPALAADCATDLLVIGGGFTGCAAALTAAESGADVMVVEAAIIGHGGSGRNVGLVNAGLWLPPDEIIAILGETDGMRLISALGNGPQRVFDLIAKHGIDCEATRNGTLHLAHAAKGLRGLEDRYRQGNRTGAPIRLLDRAETAKRTGSSGFHGALFDPRAGTIQPLGYCRGLAKAAQNAGARLHSASKVTALRHDGQWQATVNGHQVTAKRVLLATNAYFDGIAHIPAPAFVPVHYCQFATDPLTPTQRQGILEGGEGCWDTATVMTSIRMDQAGRIIIGAVGNADGGGKTIHAAWAARKLARYYPQLAGIPFAHQWTGRIAMTGDHVPKVVAFGPDALAVYGFSGRGISPGTVFGHTAAQALLTGDRSHIPLPVVDHYSETLTGLRAAYYETGAVLTHAIDARI